MTIRKTLTSLVLAGALALGVAGCTSKLPSPYDYEGKIGQEYVNFKGRVYYIGGTENILTVKKSDGRVIEYTDLFGNDLKIEHVKIMKGLGVNSYSSSDEAGRRVLKEAQKQFDSYLQKIEKIKHEKNVYRITQEFKNQEKIKEERVRQGLEDLK